MFSHPPRTSSFSSLFSLSLCLFFGALISTPSKGADPLPPTKLEMPIPPGMSDLDTLQADYEAASKKLQGHFTAIHEKAPACEHGQKLAKLFEKSAPAQAHQRQKIVDSLNQSKLELQMEVAKLDGMVAEMKLMNAGTAMVESSKTLLAAGTAVPLKVIAEEKEKMEKHNKVMQHPSVVSAAHAALEGTAARCREANDVYFKEMRPLALEMPGKLEKVKASLEAHGKALEQWTSGLAPKVAGR